MRHASTHCDTFMEPCTNVPTRQLNHTNYCLNAVASIFTLVEVTLFSTIEDVLYYINIIKIEESPSSTQISSNVRSFAHETGITHL